MEEDLQETKVIVSPDIVMYRDVQCKESLLTFYGNYIEFHSTPFGVKAPISFEWATADVVSIESQWHGEFETAFVNLRLRSKETNVIGGASESSGIVELKFAVCDSQWFEKQEAIKSLDVRYKAAWNVVFDIDAVSRGPLLEQYNIFSTKQYCLDSDESFKDVIYPKGDPDAVSIGKRDVERLQPKTFINDTIIDFYIQYLKNKISPDQKQRFHFFNSFFFRKLADLDKDPSRDCESRAAFQRVCKWTRRVYLFEKDYIFIPVNFSLHWSLIVICHPGEVANSEDEDMEKTLKVPCILHMDSIKGSHRGLKNLIRSYLLEEWKDRHIQPVADISSKFLNLLFISLELPQQENSFDCGLFLLHYVELFLEQAPVNFSPFRTTTVSNFLNKDWFPPAVASLKRDHIKKLIYEIVKDSQSVTPAACNDGDSLDLADVKEGDRDVEILQEEYNSTGTFHGIYSNSNADQEINMPPLCITPLRCVQGSRELELVSVELLKPGDNVMPLIRGNYKPCPQTLSLERFKNAMPPIEEVEETEQISCSQGLKACGSQVPKPVASSTTSSDVQFHADDQCEEIVGLSPDEENECESSSMCGEGIATCIVEDSEDMKDAHDVSEGEGSPAHQDGYLVLSCQEGEYAERMHHKTSNMDLTSALDKGKAPKRPRPMPAAVSPTSSDVRFCKDNPYKEFVGSSIDEEKNTCESPSVSGDRIATYVVEDSEDTNKTHDVSEGESSPADQDRVLALSCLGANSAEKMDHKTNYIDPTSALDNGGLQKGQGRLPAIRGKRLKKVVERIELM